MNNFAQNFAHFVGQRTIFITKEKKKYKSINKMKKKIEKPEVKVMKLQEMNVIATSGGSYEPSPAKASLEGMTWHSLH